MDEEMYVSFGEKNCFLTNIDNNVWNYGQLIKELVTVVTDAFYKLCWYGKISLTASEEFFVLDVSRIFITWRHLPVTGLHNLHLSKTRVALKARRVH